MADVKDRRAAVALAAQDMSEAANKPAEQAAKLSKADPEPAKIPADVAGPIANSTPKPATALENPAA